MESHKLAVIVLVLFFAAFLLSTVTLTVIQTRLIQQFGWRVFRERSMRELYWKNLSPKERVLLWPGIVLFLLVLFGGTVSMIVDSLG